MKFSTILMVIAIIAVSSSSGFGQSAAQIGASKDNTLYEDPNGSLSNGAGDHLFAGNTGGGLIRRGLLKFDIDGQVPAGATIDSVRLTLYMSRTISGNQQVELRRVLSDWGEGTSHAPGEEGGGAPATSGDATWIHTFYDTQFWTNAGGDFSAIASASRMVGDATFYTWGSTPEMVADVQDWLDNPANNFGWAIICNEAASSTAKRFDSRENPNSNRRPLLTVYYSPPTAISGDDPAIIDQFRLFQNYPNPFNPSTTISFQLPQSAFVTLNIYNVLGQEIVSLVNRQMGAGKHQARFEADKLPAGIYYYELVVGDFREMKKMVLVK